MVAVVASWMFSAHSVLVNAARFALCANHSNARVMSLPRVGRDCWRGRAAASGAAC